MTTSLKILGFHWELKNNYLNSEKFCEYLCSISGEQFTKGKKKDNDDGAEDSEVTKKENKEIMTIIKKDDLYIGVFISINDMESYCLWKESGEDFELASKEVDDGHNMADFNFFIINPEFDRGLYQYYHKSATLNKFHLFCQRRYNDYKKKCCDEEIALESAKIKNTISDKQKGLIRSKYKGLFRYSPILKPDTFDEYIDKLSDISFFEFEAITPGIIDSDKVAFGKYAKKSSHKLYFENTGSFLTSIKSSINAMVRSDSFKRAKVKGIDPENNETVYNLFNNNEVFEEYEFNEVAKTVKLDSKNMEDSLKESHLIKLLEKVYNDEQVNAIMTIPFKN